MNSHADLASVALSGALADHRGTATGTVLEFVLPILSPPRMPLPLFVADGAVLTTPGARPATGGDNPT